MKIGVIGSGRLGICFALLLEKAGYEVLVSDIREEYIEALQNKEIFTSEPEVIDLLKESKNLFATTSNEKVIKECDIIYTLVATPSLPTGDYDVSAVWQVVDDIINSGVKNKSFVVGCTTNPDDCTQFQKKLNDCGWDVFYNPEFIAQGSIIKDLRNADMVLIGGSNIKVYEQLCELYTKIQVQPPKLSFMSTTSAELVKLAVNCFLTAKFSYANIGKKYLNYGYGFGGPCLPRDNRSFAAYAKKLGLQYNLGKVTDDFNNEHSLFLKNYFIKKNINNLPFCFHYVTYKETTDILTESQQYRLCLDLLNEGYKVYVVDSLVKSQCDERIIWGVPCEEVFWVDL
jgi:UDP-glucose 6-dehydrogenase